jgi:hypothetical protein
MEKKCEGEERIPKLDIRDHFQKIFSRKAREKTCGCSKVEERGRGRGRGRERGRENESKEMRKNSTKDELNVKRERG